MTKPFDQARIIFRVVRLFPRAGRGLAVSFWLFVVLNGLIPIANIIATTNLARVAARFIIDGTGTESVGSVFPAVLLVAGLFLFQQVSGPASYWVNESLGDRLSELWRERVMDSALKPSGIAHLENPDSADRLWAAAGLDQRSLAPWRLVAAVAEIVVWRIQGFVSAFLLAIYAWWMPPVLIIAWLPLWYVVVARTHIQLTNAEHGSRELRRAAYFRNTAMGAGAAKEIQLFHLDSWFLDAYDRFYDIGSRDMWRDHGFTRWAYVPFLLAPAIVSSIILGRGAYGVISGTLTVPDITFITLSVIGAQRIGKAMAWWTRSFSGAGAISDGIGLGDAADIPQAELPGRNDVSTVPERIRFDNVRFAYPGAKHEVFRGIDIELRRGESVAIVGPNGAGKTTLMKLLARLYDPQEGSILIGDRPLSTISPESWRKRIAVIFQDFIRYEMTAAENIGVGAVDRITDPGVVEEAARKSGVDELIRGFEHGYQTILARGYTRSRDLSGGEWQRVALARAFAAVEAGAEILVLDEPTANLDVDAEAAFYDRFLELTRGLTAILITHRMASVRHAGRIYVIDDGRVIETGSHDELLERGGAYARMFEVQARQFAGANDRPEEPS